jgi:DNA phosphorothioation-dependent restriction protein DptH
VSWDELRDRQPGVGHFLMGAVGNQATYIRQLNRVMKTLRDDFTLESLNQGIEASSLPDYLKSMAKMRLQLASEYIDDSVRSRMRNTAMHRE